MMVYDIEIIRAIPSPNAPREEGIEYVESWTDFSSMGIAVLACYDYARDCSRVFCQDNLADFLTLAHSHDICVGFNNHRFDNKILESNALVLNSSYDLFEEIQRGLKLNFNNPAERRAGYGLSSMAFANFRANKSGDGAQAPIDFQRGRIGKTVDYCLQDVYLTKRLLDKVIRRGFLNDPHDTKTLIPVRRP